MWDLKKWNLWLMCFVRGRHLGLLAISIAPLLSLLDDELDEEPPEPPELFESTEESSLESDGEEGVGRIFVALNAE